MTRRPLVLAYLVLSLFAAASLWAPLAGAAPAKSDSSKSDSPKSDSGTKASSAAKPAASSAKSSGATKSDPPAKASEAAKPAEAAPAPADAAPKIKTVLVKAEEATLRAEASTKGKSLDTLTRFTPVQVLGTQDKFAQVQAGEKTGYILTESLTDSPFVSTTVSGKERANVRATSASDAMVLIELDNHYPLRILSKEGKRAKVVDWEGDGGWIHESYLSLDRYVVAVPPAGQGDWINLRDKPGLDKSGKALGAKRFMAQKGSIFRVLESQEGWLRVKHADPDHPDGDEGWCSANIVWGWNEK